MHDTPGYLWALSLAGTIGIPTMTCIALYRGTERAGLGRQRARRLAGAAGAVLAGWYAVAATLAAGGAFHTQLPAQPPWLLITAVGVLLAVLAMSRIPTVGRALSAPNTASSLTLPHLFRVAGLAFLITMALGRLPALFAVPAGLGDIAVGLAAPGIARRLRRGTGRRAALWFNTLGIVDLLVALSLGGLTGYRIIDLTPVNDAISELPLALIPTTAVPLLLALHIVSIRQLLHAARTPRQTAGRLATVS